jgi:mRNA interferase MazF
LPDLSQTKRRPALVLAALQGDDQILCQITGQAREDGYSVRLEGSDFVNGGLNQSRHIRPNRLFAADSGIVRYRAGQVSPDKLNETIAKLIAILNAN